jgi:hypothetical protein
MTNHSRIFAFAILAAIALLSACNSGPGLGDNVIAERFLGSAPVAVSGPDAGNDAAVDEAAEMLTGRRFDLTPSGFTISSGPVNSLGPASSDYGVAGGTLGVSGDQATVNLDVFSTNPDVTNAELEGTFSLSEATQALTNPGDVFVVDWEVRFDYLGFPVQLDVEQQLTGSDFVDQD